MILQDLNEIDKAEKEAKNIISSAKQKSSIGIKSAEDTAKKRISDFENKASQKYLKIIDDTLALEKQNIDGLENAGKIEVDGILNISDTKINKAVDFIFKKVVDSYGNI